MAEDPKNTGVLQFDTVRQIVTEAVSGLSRIQIHAVMSESVQHQDGTITYKDFAPVAAGVLLTMEDVRAQRVWEAQQDGEAPLGEDEDNSDMPGLPSTEELSEIVLATFVEADTEENGYIDYQQFAGLFKSLSDQLPLGDKDIAFIMAEADENQDGVIEYREFVPLAVDLIESIYAKTTAQMAVAQADEDAHEAAVSSLLNGMSREELDATLLGIFQQSDKDGSGYLDRKEFQSCLRSSGLGLKKKQINALLAQTDVDGDNKVTYEEFLPTCFGMLVEILSREIKHDAESPELAAVENFLMENFMAEDPKNTGVLQFDIVRQIVTEAVSGLSRIQIHAVMSESVQHQDGTITYKDFAPVAAGVLLTMEDVRAQRVWEAQQEEGN